MHTILRRIGGISLVGNQRIGLDGTTTYFSIEPGFYQLAVDLFGPSTFSTGVFDSAGNQTNVIRTVITNTNGTRGFSACTDFTDGATAFGPIGIR